MYLGDYGIDCSAILIEDRLFLTKVNDASFIKSGIKIKDEIISIDGVSIYEWPVSQMQYISASTFPNDISKATWKVFNTQFNGNRVYEIRTAEGIRSIETQLNVPVDYRKLFSSNTPTLKYLNTQSITPLDDGISSDVGSIAIAIFIALARPLNTAS